MPRLDSLLLASTEPERLRAWYAAAFQPDSDDEMDGYRVLRFGGFHVLIDQRADISAANPEPGRLILNLEVDDARAIAERLEGMGADWVAELEDRDGSLFATVVDPDGNYVQIIQLSEEHLAAMRAGQPSFPAGRPFSGFSVDDIEAAADFYANVLEVQTSLENGMLVLHLANGNVLVYPKPDHTPASFTVLNFPVADIERAVDDLASKGVRFQRHDGFDPDERAIHRGEGPAIAWFTDPAGNVLSVLQDV